MAAIAVQPHVLKDMVFTVGLDDYEAHLSSCEIVPTTETPQIKWQGLTPTAAFSEAGTPTTSWALVVNSAQDWETANSFSQYCMTNARTTKSVVLKPQRGKGKKFSFDVTIVPGRIGGELNTVATAGLTMPIDGEPIMAAHDAV